MSGGWKRVGRNLFLLALFALLVGRTVLRAKPFLNWDVLVYMALALEWEVDDPVEVHRRTYAAAEDELSLPEFRWLTSSQLMRARYEDPAAFHEHLGFFRSRAGYTGILALLHRAGVPLTGTVHVLSLGAWVAFALLFLVWASRHLPFWAAVPASLFFAHAPPLLAATSYATADGPAALVLLAGIYCLHERRSIAAGGALLALSVLLRTDAIVFVLAWTVLVLLFERTDRALCRGLLVTSVASLVAFFGVTAWAHDYGWWRLFQVSFIAKSLHPSALSSTPDLGTYFAVLSDIASAMPGNGYFETERTVVGSTLAFTYAGFALAGIVFLGRSGGRARSSVLLSALTLATLARWILFPRLWDRYHVLFYAAVPLVLLSAAMGVLRRDAPEVHVAR